MNDLVLLKTKIIGKWHKYSLNVIHPGIIIRLIL